MKGFLQHNMLGHIKGKITAEDMTAKYHTNFKFVP